MDSTVAVQIKGFGFSDFAGLTALDDLFQVGGEVRVERRFVAQFFGVSFGQRDGFGKQPDMGFGRTNHGHGPHLVSDEGAKREASQGRAYCARSSECSVCLSTVAGLVAVLVRRPSHVTETV